MKISLLVASYKWKWKIAVFRLKAVWKRFKSIIIVYLLFIVLLYSSFIFHDAFVDLIEKKWGIEEGFLLSWQSSLFQDLLFFGFTGFLGMILTTKLPHEENFDSRTAALSNALIVGDRAKEFVKEEIKRLLLHNAQSNIRLSIERVIDLPGSPGQRVVELYCERTNEVANMCADIRHEATLQAQVIPGPCYQGSHGYLKQLSYENLADRDVLELTPDGIVTLTEDGYRNEKSMYIPPNGAIRQTLKYSIFCPIDGDRENDNHKFTSTHSIFTERFTLQLKNKTNFEIFFDFEYPNREKKSSERPTPAVISGTSNISPLISNVDNKSLITIVEGIYMHRGDIFSLYFYTQPKAT